MTHLRRIRKGEYSPSPLIRSKLEEALHWAPGSIESVLDGGDPTDLGEPVDVTVQGRAGSIVTRAGQGSVQTDNGLQAAIRELARRLPPEDVRALLEEFTGAEPAGENPYTDAGERRIWEMTELPEAARVHLVVMLRAWRAASTVPAADRAAREARMPVADVREFRQRG